jgi:hypothetical protein
MAPPTASAAARSRLPSPRTAGGSGTPVPTPPTTAPNGDHAFVDVAADAAGTFHLVWLDARGGAGAGKGLRYARSTDGGVAVVGERHR